MKSNWKEYCLGDIVSLVIDHRGLTPKKLGGDWANEGYRALSAKNVKTGRIVQPDSIRYVDDEMYHRWMPDEIERGDILVTSEAPFGEVLQWNSDEKIVLSQRLFGLRISEEFNSDYVYHYMTTTAFLAEMHSRATGTTVIGLRQPELLKCKLFCPDIETQKKIASLLNGLDRKIELNERINDNLLQQVTACFHHHFDAYEASTDAIGSLGDMAQFKYGTMPKKDKLGSGEYVAFSGYQVVGSYPEKMFSTPQLIVVARGVGGCGDIKYTPSNCYLTNLSIAILTQNTAIEDYLFNYLRLHDTTVMNTGSAQPQITVSTLEKYQLPIPPEYLLASFSTFVQPFKTLYRKNKAEIERLQVLRDTLLPRLMSGELDVSNIGR